MKYLHLCGAFVPAALLPAALQVRFGPSLPFFRGAVLQRDQPMRPWGRDAPGARVTPGSDGAHAEAVADAKVRWDATLRRPAAVRHAWSEYPLDADLVDHTGLQASSCRTRKPAASMQPAR